MTLPRGLWPILLTLLLLPTLAMADDCLSCHSEKTPGAVRQWQQSAHAGKAGCADCHGRDHAAIDAGQATVTAAVCGRCHAAAYDQHRQSRHGMGLHSGWGCTRTQPDRDQRECAFCHEQGSGTPLSTVACARFLTQSSAVGALGCNRCHQVESSCASCHGNHLTDLAIVRDPNVCATCHMGPDHAQWEMWQTSRHGTLYTTLDADAGPSCQRCHMPAGTHDVSAGLTMTPGGALYPEEQQPQRRAAMLERCSDCHSRTFAARELANGDAIRQESLALVKEAEAIVWDLNDRGLLDPMPNKRPPHPLRGQQLVTDGQMLYEETSHIERLLFKMKKYDLAKTVKGAYHQNPAWMHWYGNAELKMDLVDIRAEASRLEKPSAKAAPDQKGTEGDRIERELETLKNRFDRGAIDAETYKQEKEKVLRNLDKR